MQIDFLTEKDRLIIQNLSRSINELDNLIHLEELADSLRKKEEENYRHVVQYAKRESKLQDKINELENDIFKNNEIIIRMQDSIRVKNNKIRHLIQDIHLRQRTRNIDKLFISIFIFQIFYLLSTLFFSNSRRCMSF